MSGNGRQIDHGRRILFDAAEVERALVLITVPGQITELRALDATTQGDRWPATFTGYFDDPQKLVAALADFTSAKGIYVVANPLDPALLARAANRIKKAGKGDSASDNDVTSRAWVLIDCDPQRPAGISSTDAEHEAALQRAAMIRDELHYNYGWPAPIEADSGNGGHLMYRIDLPCDDGGQVEKCLAALAARFDDEAVKIDQKVFNPARVWKLYGTLACKGDSTSDRPHRMSRIISAPNSITVVDRGLLEAVAAEAPAGESPRREPSSRNNGHAFDVDAFMARNGFEADGPDEYQGGRRWTFRTSPMCTHHRDGPYLIQFASGALSAGCHHNSCVWGWSDLRARYEPSQATQKLNNGANVSRSLGTIEPYHAFPVEVLPAVVQDYVSAAATAIGCDPSFIALPLLACLARAIGNKRVIRLKRTWMEPAIIWAAIVGKSGTHKSPALQAATSFLNREQAKAIAAFQEALVRFEQDKAVYDRDYQAWKRAKTSEPPPWPPEEPVCQRFVTTDCTIEALAFLLHCQFDGVLVPRDELAGWLNGIAEYKGGKGSDLGHWLASWSAAPMTVDRKTGAIKMIHVPRAAVSIVGGIQPGVLRKAIGQEHMQDGLCARMLLAMPDSKPVRWTEAVVDAGTEALMGNTFERLIGMTSGADGDGNAAPYPMPLTDTAKGAWVDYFNRHRAELSELDDDLAAAWSKLEAYTARFALIFQLCSWAAGQGRASDQVVDEAAMRSAIRLSDWFGREAKRVYALFHESSADCDKRELVELIRRKGGGVTARDLMRSSRRYSTAAEADGALDELQRAGIGHWEDQPPGPKGGKPTRIFRLADVVDVDDTVGTYGERNGYVNVGTVDGG